MYVFVDASLLLDPDKSLLQVNTNTYAHAQRAIVVALLCSILTGNVYNNTVLLRSVLMERLYQDAKNVSYVSLLLDTCCITAYMMLHCMLCQDPPHGPLSTNITSVSVEHNASTHSVPNIVFCWSLVGTGRAGVDVVYRHLVRASMPPAVVKAHVLSLNMLYVCMSLTLTSASLQPVCMQMTVHEVLLRLAFHAALVVVLCYSEGLASTGVSSDIHHLYLFAWAIMYNETRTHLAPVPCTHPDASCGDHQ